MTGASPDTVATERLLASGDGWRVIDHVCRAGPADPAFEERHERASVAVVLDGSFTYRSGSGRVLMSPGSLLLGNRHSCFACAHDHGRGDRCVAFQFDPCFMEDAAGDLRGVGQAAFPRHRLPPVEELAPLVARAAVLVAEPCPGMEPAEELSTALLSAALRMARDADEPAVSLRDEARVAAALAHIRSGEQDGLRLADLAAAAGVTRHHFLRVFRAVVGVTPYRYILARRLTTAAAALETGDGSVLEVALAAGFSDLSEFTRRFRRRFGMPPAAYRRRHRE